MGTGLRLGTRQRGLRRGNHVRRACCSPSRGWANGWLAYTAYAVAFILARIFFSHAADAIGGAKVALVCALIEAVGQALIWLAVRPEMALARGRTHRLRLLAGLSRLWRRSGPPRAGTEPRPGHGSLHRLSRPGPGARKPGAWIGREAEHG